PRPTICSLPVRLRQRPITLSRVTRISETSSTSTASRLLMSRRLSIRSERGRLKLACLAGYPRHPAFAHHTPRNHGGCQPVNHPGLCHWLLYRILVLLLVSQLLSQYFLQSAYGKIVAYADSHH